MSALGITLCAATGATLLLPFVPALREWTSPTDVAPLPIPADGANRLAHFAESLAARLRQLYGIDMQDPDSLVAARAHDGGDLSVITERSGKGGHRALLAMPHLKDASHTAAFLHDVVVGRGMRIGASLVSMGMVTVGAGARLRACLARGEIRLGAGATIDHWAHGHAVRVAGGFSAPGRLTATSEIHFDGPASFARASAPRICFGIDAAASPAPFPESGDERASTFVRSDAVLGKAWCPGADVVVSGTCELLPGTALRGSVKSHGDLRIGSGCIVPGTAASRKDIHIAGAGAILGPITSHGDVYVGARTRIGRPDAPTTVVCQRLYIEAGVVIHGVIAARQAVYMPAGVRGL